MLPTLAQLFPPIVWIVSGGLFLTLGDVIIRFWISSNWLPGFFLGFTMYLIGIFALIMSFFGQNIAVASVAIIIVNIATLTIVNAYFFNVHLSTIQYIGIVFGLVSFTILEFFGN